MTEKVETPFTQLQRVTLLVTMHDYNENDLDAGHWLINVLETCANKQSNGHYAAKMYGQAMQLLEVVDCEVVVSDGV